MLKQYEGILDSYRDWHPSLYEKTIDCRPSGHYSIVARLYDGSRIEYNSLDNSIRDVTRFYICENDNEIDEETWRKEFGRQLRRLIAERGINQDRLSELTGISRQMLSRYVNGNSTPSGYVLSRLSTVLGSDVRELTRFGYIDKD
jgi:predicted XRE-type DNA-binding protein